MSFDESTLFENIREVLRLIARALPPRPSEHVQPAVIPLKRPAIIGLSGLQGSGKSTWAAAIVSILKHDYGLRAISVSLDDFYEQHDALVKLRESNVENKLFRTRGQPGTHDELLAEAFFARARAYEADSNEKELRIPVFDKSAFNGEGDRAPQSIWPVVELPVDVIVFEGWCVGFKEVSETELMTRYEAAVKHRKTEIDHEGPANSSVSKRPTETLADHAPEHLIRLNENLKKYNATFMGPQNFDGFIHLDTDTLANVYEWRLDQEQALRRRTGGRGMTTEAVIDFVRGYMPAYELYLDRLREGFFFEDDVGRKPQVRVCMDVGRHVEKIQ